MQIQQTVNSMDRKQCGTSENSRTGEDLKNLTNTEIDRLSRD